MYINLRMICTITTCNREVMAIFVIYPWRQDNRIFGCLISYRISSIQCILPLNTLIFAHINYSIIAIDWIHMPCHAICRIASPNSCMVLTQPKVSRFGYIKYIAMTYSFFINPFLHIIYCILTESIFYSITIYGVYIIMKGNNRITA